MISGLRILVLIIAFQRRGLVFFSLVFVILFFYLEVFYFSFFIPTTVPTPCPLPAPPPHNLDPPKPHPLLREDEASHGKSIQSGISN